MVQFALNVTRHAQYVQVHQQIAPHAVRTIIWRIVDATSALRDAQPAVLPQFALLVTQIMNLNLISVSLAQLPNTSLMDTAWTAQLLVLVVQDRLLIVHLALQELT